MCLKYKNDGVLLIEVITKNFKAAIPNTFVFIYTFDLPTTKFYKSWHLASATVAFRNL